MANPPTILDAGSPNLILYSFTVAFTLLAMVYTGFNRFIFIPLWFTIFNVISNIAGFWTWNYNSDGTPKSSSASVFFTYLGYYAGELLIVMYGYYFVERLLPRRSTGWLLSRKLFLIIFWPLQFANFATRLVALIWAVVAYRKLDTTSETDLTFHLTLVHFLITTAIEIFTAYALIVIFRRSRKVAIHFLGGKRLGLIKHLLLSTEVRVASLSVFYLFRSACELPKRISRKAKLIDNAVNPLINLFSLVLVLDCVLRKAIQIEIDAQSRIEKCVCTKDAGDGNESGATPPHLPSKSPDTKLWSSIVKVDSRESRSCTSA